MLADPTKLAEFLPEGVAWGDSVSAYMVEEIVHRATLAERERCAKLARNACLVPPDGGSPNDEEAALCAEIAGMILESGETK